MSSCAGAFFLLCILRLFVIGCSSILPTSLDCTRSAHAVDVPEPGGASFSCPEYFASKACCPSEQVQAIEDKLENIIQFVLRILDEQSQDLGPEVFEVDGPCGEYYSGLFASRTANYLEARKATEKGLEILQGATTHLLCAACFVCRAPGKPAQIDDFTSRALQSVQDRMGAIFQEQLIADIPPSEECALAYVTSLTEGIALPAYGRFAPEMIAHASEMLNVTFVRWMDRVLSMLTELPGILFFQRSILQLAFFYVERPDSDAFKLLHGPLGEAAAQSSDLADLGGEPFAGLCPDTPRRLLLYVSKDLATSKFVDALHAFREVSSNWGVRWLLSSPEHIEALQGEKENSTFIWRRFQVGDLDAMASAVCGESPAWVGNLSLMKDGKAAALVMQRLGEAPQLEDLQGLAYPEGLRPAKPLPAPPVWPAAPFTAYMKAHNNFCEAMKRGEESTESRILVYTCTSMSMCGGHGDRLNGMLSAMVIALLSGRLFFIDSTRPVPLSLVLRPRNLDWQLFGTHATFPAGFNWQDDLAGFEKDPFHVLDHQASVIRFISNQRLSPAALLAAPQRAAALGLAPLPKLHAHLFQTLFEPSPALRHRLAARNLPEGRLIGIHFRAGDQMPQHWKDPPRHSLAEIEEFLACAESLEASLDWKATFVLFADTDRVLQNARVQALIEQGKVIWPAQTDGLVHLDRSPATLSVRGLLSTWADWWTLAFDVHALVVCHSGFGATALEIGPQRPAFLGKGCIPAEGSMI